MARDDRTEPLGDKCQRLMGASAADYTCLCGDDALLHPNYVEWFHDAMQFDPDVIGFHLRIGDRPSQPHSIAVHDDPTFKPWGPVACDFGTWMPVKRSIGSLVHLSGRGRMIGTGRGEFSPRGY